jgi:hypothetical protein
MIRILAGNHKGKEMIEKSETILLSWPAEYLSRRKKKPHD